MSYSSQHSFSTKSFNAQLPPTNPQSPLNHPHCLHLGSIISQWLFLKTHRLKVNDYFPCGNKFHGLPFTPLSQSFVFLLLFSFSFPCTLLKCPLYKLWKLLPEVHLFPKSHLESMHPLSVLFVKFPLTIYISIFLLLLPLHCHHCFLPLIAVCTLSSLVLPFWRPNRTEGPIVPLFTISGTASPTSPV